MTQTLIAFLSAVGQLAANIRPGNALAYIPETGEILEGSMDVLRSIAWEELGNVHVFGESIDGGSAEFVDMTDAVMAR